MTVSVSIFCTNLLVGGAGNNNNTSTLQGEDVTGSLSTLNAQRKEHLDTKELPSLQSKGNYGAILIVLQPCYDQEYLRTSSDISREDGTD